MEENTNTIEKKYKIWIIILSIAIPLVVAVLFSVKLKDLGFNVTPLHFLPPIYAAINGITAIVLIAALMAIKNNKRKLHENLMKFAICLSVAFLAMYVAYHMTTASTVFGDENHDGVLSSLEGEHLNLIRLVYILILVSHIILSIAVIPMVLVSYVRGLSQQFDKHRKIAKITFPIWLYVAITGVIVYLMISPYYVK
ncbi:MAG: DUF420 domain-containing protein [Bacteroidota bacterium]